MEDLGPEHVKALARAVGLTIADDDLTDVTFRLGATLDRLGALDALDLLRVGGAAGAGRGDEVGRRPGRAAPRADRRATAARRDRGAGTGLPRRGATSRARARSGPRGKR